MKPAHPLLAAVVAVGGALALASFHRARPGETSPSFEAEDLDGRPVKLESFRGRPLLVNFWATWCGPCRAEFPDLQALADEHCAAIVGIAVNSGSREQVAEFARAHMLRYPILMGNARIVDAFDVEEIPRSVLLDAEGRTIAGWVGPIDRASMRKAVRSLFPASC
jgi:thiol-disulfide isomerase/thioredoxin